MMAADHNFYLYRKESGGTFHSSAAAAVISTVVFLAIAFLLVPTPALSYGVSFLNEFGTHGKADGNLRGPEALAVDTQGELYVADTDNDRIQVFSPEGAFLLKWGHGGSGRGEFDNPSGIAVGNGKVFVADTDNDRIQIFDKGGRYIDSFGRSGDDPKEFKEPRGIAFWNGLLYVADSGNDRVQVFSEDGIFLREINGKDRYMKMDEPYAISVDHDGHIFVLDTSNGLTVIDRSGMISGAYMSLGYGMSAVRAVWAAGGGIYLATKNKVYKYDSTLKNTFAFGSESGGIGTFKSISAVAADPLGNLFVLDKERNSVQRFMTEVSATEESVPDIPSSVTYVREISLPSSGVMPGESGRLFVLDKNAESLGTLYDGDDKTGADNLSRTPGSSGKHLWIVDKDRHCLREYDEGGKFIRTVGSKGKGEGQFYYPSAIVSLNDALYVADSGNARIQVFDGAGKFIRSFGREGKGKGELQSPVGLAFDDKDNLFVVDEELNKVVETDSAGNFITEFGGAGKRAGQFDSPESIAVGGGEVYVLDAGNNRVEVFNEAGEYLRQFGSEGRGKGEFGEPTDMFLDHNYNIFIRDKRNHRVEVLKLLLTPSSPRALRADGMIKEIKVTWLPASESYVASYKIFRRKGDEEGFEEVGRVDAGVSYHRYAYFDKNLKSDTDFHYAVAAVSRTGNMSPLSNVVDARTIKLVPSVPKVDKVEAGQRELLIQWLPSPETYTDHYIISRNNEIWHSFTDIGETGKCSFRDTNLTPNTLYKYRIVAVGREGDRSGPLDIETRTKKLPPIEIVRVDLEDVFVNNYKAYEVNPVGKVFIKNNSDNPITNIKVSLMVSGYMDYPTEEVVDKLDGGRRKEVPLKAVFNNKVLDLTENSSLQSEVSVSFFEDQGKKSISVSQPLKFFEKHALIWDRTAKAALFITPKDPALLDFATRATAGYGSAHLNSALLKAKGIFEALGISGITYMQDPNNPYQIVSQEVSTVDYVQYPRETFDRRAGDCDDLAVLYSSMLESLGVDTALAVYPGHIFLLAGTGMNSGDGNDFGFPPEDYVVRDDTIWIPVEVTLVGNSFTEAWKKGLDEYNEWKDKGIEIVRVSDAWRDFKPATLEYRDWKPQPVTSAEIGDKFPGELKDIQKRKMNYLSSLSLNSPDTSYSLGELGILYGENGMYRQAIKVFEKYVKISGEDAEVLNNMGNVYFLQGKYRKAERMYLKALRYDLQDAGIMVNFARCYYSMGNKEKARKYLEKAIEIDPEVARKYSYATSE